MNIRGVVALLVVLLQVTIAKADGSVKIRFNNKVNGQSLVLNESDYINANGDSFTVSMCKYYVSNISLLAADKAIYTENESYHLINETKPSSKEFLLSGVKQGRYSAIRFLIGVDSLHNVSGAQSGALDPINAMFWDWNTGYIMAKIEGNAPHAEDSKIEFHIGGFSGATSSLRWVTLVFPQPLECKDEKIPLINISSDIAEWFKTPQNIDFSKTPVITTESKEATMIADNYADMFTIENIGL